MRIDILSYQWQIYYLLFSSLTNLQKNTFIYLFIYYNLPKNATICQNAHSLTDELVAILFFYKTTNY